MGNYVAVSPTGFLYGVGESKETANMNAKKEWRGQWGSDGPIPIFDIKLDDGTYIKLFEKKWFQN